MPLAMIEPLADTILAQLQANLPAKIAALQPTFVPALAMPAPAGWVFGEVTNFVTNYPVVQVLQLRTHVRNEDLRWQDHAHYLEVGIFVAESNDENLARLLDRYTRCLLETMHERRKAGAFLPWDLAFKDEDINYGRAFGGGASEVFIRGVFIPVHATRRDQEAA